MSRMRESFDASTYLLWWDTNIGLETASLCTSPDEGLLFDSSSSLAAPLRFVISK